MRRARCFPAFAARLLVAAGAAGLMPIAALARDLTPDERASLVRALDSFVAASVAVDGTALAAALPPRMLASLGAQAGIDADTQRRVIAAQFDAAKAGGLHLTMAYDLDGATFASLKDGTPYAVVPMHGVEDSPVHQNIDVKALALMEDGGWHFLSLGTPTRMARLHDAYPEFDGAALDDGATPAVKP